MDSFQRGPGRHFLPAGLRGPADCAGFLARQVGLSRGAAGIFHLGTSAAKEGGERRLGERCSALPGEPSMENILLIALSRQTALQRELEVVANNIANINSTGFKADGAVFSEFLQPEARAEQFVGQDRVLSYVQDYMTWHDMAQGPVQETGNPLDVAIDGDGMLVVQTPRGERYTRNGSLQINAAGELVTGSGDRVMGDSGPIVLASTDRDIVITKDGTIRVREGQSLNSDSTRGRLRLVSFANPQVLLKDGASNFRAPDGVLPQPAVNATIKQGSIEKSNVRSVIEMTRMIQLTRAYTEVAGIIQQQNELQRSSIRQLAEVPA
jgi:flagellar basal-body rod protein FlgF